MKECNTTLKNVIANKGGQLRFALVVGSESEWIVFVQESIILLLLQR